MLSASLIHQSLRENDVTHVVGLPDNICRELFLGLHEDPDIEVVEVTREGEAFAIAAGLYLGGKKAVVLVQNTGLLEAGDAFRGTSWNMQIPQVMLIGYRGFKTLSSGSQKKDSVAELTEPTLKAWKIPYKLINSDEDIGSFEQAFELAEESSRPAAVLIAQPTG